MPLYEYECLECGVLDEIDVPLSHFENTRTLPCTQPNCRGICSRLIGGYKVAAELKGACWADDGYYRYTGYDIHKREGKRVKPNMTKEDITRELKGEREQATRNRLKKINEAAKRHLGQEYAVTEKQAAEKIRKEVESVKV